MDELERTFENAMVSARIQQEENSAAIVTTKLESPWLHRTCTVCGHTFRAGDRVACLSEGQTYVHASNELPCDGDQSHNLNASRERSEFLAGLDEGWPPPEELKVVILDSNAPRQSENVQAIVGRLLAEPKDEFPRRKCNVCRHTLRSLDRVVICPCQPDQPLCEVAMHRDPSHNMNCFSEWNPGVSRNYCPITSRPLDNQ